MATCSKITLYGLICCFFAKMYEIIQINNNPYITETIIATDKENNKNGTIKVNAKINLDKNVENVACQTDLGVLFFSYSDEICIPKASERASAIAIKIIPVTTIVVECVLASKPIIKPNVVITPEVIPNPKPFLFDEFIFFV